MDGIRLYGDEIRGAGVCGDTRKKVDAASRDVALRVLSEPRRSRN